MKKNGKLVAAIVAVVVLIAAFAAIWYFTRPDVNDGTKTITVEVVYKDGSTKNFTYTSDKEYLGEVLVPEGLVTGEDGPYGLYITAVDGESAIYEEDGSYWALYQNGEYAPQSMDQTPIHDGDSFSLVYTVG